MKEQVLKEEEKQVLAEFFANQVKLSEKGQSLLDVVSFIYHYNINRGNSYINSCCNSHFLALNLPL